MTLFLVFALGMLSGGIFYVAFNNIYYSLEGGRTWLRVSVSLMMVILCAGRVLFMQKLSQGEMTGLGGWLLSMSIYFATLRIIYVRNHFSR